MKTVASIYEVFVRNKVRSWWFPQFQLFYYWFYLWKFYFTVGNIVMFIIWFILNNLNILFYFKFKRFIKISIQIFRQ